MLVSPTIFEPMESIREIYTIGHGPSSSHTMGPKKAAERAVSHNTYAFMSDGRHRISFDEAVKTMYETGIDLQSHYRETLTGGLARLEALPKC